MAATTIATMERTETVSKSQQGSPLAPPRIKGLPQRPSQKRNKIIGEPLRPVEGFGALNSGWGDNDDTLQPGDTAKKLENIEKAENDDRVEVEIKTGTAKHVPIPEFYEETVEIEDRAIPGMV